MIEPRRLGFFALLLKPPLTPKERLQGERMCAAAGKPIPKLK
jgi:hypothetical protein